MVCNNAPHLGENLSIDIYIENEIHEWIERITGEARKS